MKVAAATPVFRRVCQYMLTEIIHDITDDIYQSIFTTWLIVSAMDNARIDTVVILYEELNYSL